MNRLKVIKVPFALVCNIAVFSFSLMLLSLLLSNLKWI